MKKKSVVVVLTLSLFTFFILAGAAFAANIDATSKLGGTAGDSFEFKGTGIFDSIKIGKQGVGGVTFFNGTIVNNTSKNGKDNPVTLGDSLRVDGAIWRGANSGINDSQPVKINDKLQVLGETTFNQKVKFQGGQEGLNFAAADHNHDSSYYKKTEIDSKLAGKSDTTHSHDDRYYTESETANAFISKSSPSWDDVTAYAFVGPSDFSPEEDVFAFYRPNNGDYLRATDATSRYWSANVHLPHGAVVTKVKMFYKDSSVLDATGKLIRLNLNNEQKEEMAVLSTTGDSGALTSVENSSIANSTMDNGNYQYRYTLDFNGVITIFLYNVVFEYKVSHF